MSTKEKLIERFKRLPSDFTFEELVPEKPYKGNVVLRMTSDLHQKAVEKAASLGISLNEFIKRAVAAAL